MRRARGPSLIWSTSDSAVRTPPTTSPFNFQPSASMGEHQGWFAIPSASPDKCRKVLPALRAMGYKIAVLQNQARADIPADLVVWSDTYPGWAESINILARQVVPRDCPVIVSGGDDMLPDPSQRAGELARQFLGRFPDTLGVMQ